MQQKRKSIFIISFSTIRGDSRVLRQIQYFSQYFDVTVMGYGEPHPMWKNKEHVRWLTALPISPDGSLRGRITRLANRALLVSGKLYSGSYHRLYWNQLAFRDALAKAVASGCDAFHANDWNALPIAVEAAKKLGGRVVFDAHEYAPLEFEQRSEWLIFLSPMIKYTLRRYALQADATITVAPAIAQRYRQEFGMNPRVVLNAPASVELSNGSKDFSQIRLIYHGCAQKGRRIEDIIETIALCDRRYSLHFMLTGDAPYFQELKELGDNLAPGRIVFHKSVLPEDVARQISAFDVGFCFIPPTSYSWLFSLPNKFFECIAAHLPVCIGPSPSMAEIVRSYQLGCIAPTFEPRDIAATLNQLNTEQLVSMRSGAREAAREINAEVEMGKVIEIYKELLSEDNR
ncbi:MAG: glycosyltransferase family 4 protein [Pyrinomonadaceae bacterium]